MPRKRKFSPNTPGNPWASAPKFVGAPMSAINAHLKRLKDAGKLPRRKKP